MRVALAIARWDSCSSNPPAWQLEAAEELCSILGINPDMAVERLQEILSTEHKSCCTACGGRGQGIAITGLSVICEDCDGNGFVCDPYPKDTTDGGAS